MKKVFLILGVFALLFVLVGAFVYFRFAAGMAETYSASQTSFSIDEAKKDKIFVSQPALESNVIELNGIRYSIREVWIEQATRVEYKWVVIPQRIPTGYRIMLTFTVPYDSPEYKNLINKGMWTFPIRDDTTWLTTNTSREDMELFYGQIAEPFPQSVNLKFKVYR